MSALIRHQQRPVALRFHDVFFSYGTVDVLESINFHFHEGDFIVLVGPNGAGKSTLLKLTLGLETPQRGSVSVFGKPPRDVLEIIGYVPQHIHYDSSFPISVNEVVGMGLLHPSSRRNKRKMQHTIEEALAKVDLIDLVDRSYSALSGGQRRRVLVARALVSDPRFLILDEPTANMDVESEQMLFKTLGSIKGTTTILVVTHDMEFVSSLTDRVLCLSNKGNKGQACTIVQHRTEPAYDVHAGFTQKEVLKVLHDTTLPGDDCLAQEVLHD